MSQHYSDPKRAKEPHALPNIETFRVCKGYDVSQCPLCPLPDSMSEEDSKVEHETAHLGWYWWPCFPGCMPDGDANGPFETEAEALADAQEGSDDDEPSVCEECDDAGLKHIDYPHEPGYMHGCDACDDHCHCGRADGKPLKGRASCVFSECSDEDEQEG